MAAGYHAAKPRRKQIQGDMQCVRNGLLSANSCRLRKVSSAPQFEDFMSTPRYSNVKYMLVELVVKDEHHVQFAEQMPGIIGHITARYGWEFVYGAYPLSGRMNKFVHIWRIKSEADVMKLMVDGAIAFTQAR